jgi:hypothetical protein
MVTASNFIWKFLLSKVSQFSPPDLPAKQAIKSAETGKKSFVFMTRE